MKRLTLTFDNGPIPGATDAILDLLAERGIAAVFFVVGEKLTAPAGRAIAERAIAEGHILANHTMHHLRPLGEYSDAARTVSEIAETQAILDRLPGTARLFRPPGRGQIGPHLLSAAALDHLLAERYTVVTWNNVPGDWLEPRRAWLDKALAELARQDWSVLVLHDHCQADMMELLQSFLDHVAQAGIELRTDFPPSCLPIVNGVLMLERSAISSPPEKWIEPRS